MALHNGVLDEFTQTTEDVVIQIRLPTASAIANNELIGDSFKVFFADGSKLTLSLYDDVDTRSCSGTLKDGVLKLVLAKRHHWHWSSWGSMDFYVPPEESQKLPACPSTSTPPDSPSDSASSGSEDLGSGAVGHNRPVASRRSDGQEAKPSWAGSSTTHGSSSLGRTAGSPVATNGIHTETIDPLRAIVLDRMMAVKPGRTGLFNKCSTCYLNSVVQCLSHTRVLRHFFLSAAYRRELTADNPLSYNGKLAIGFASLLGKLWSGDYDYVEPIQLQLIISKKCQQFGSLQQQDAQEFMSALLDGLHEDLNRVKVKPATPPVESGGRPDKAVAAETWKMHRLRNDSFLVDNLQGQFKSKLVCPNCKNVSNIFDPFMSLSVPVAKSKIPVSVYFVPREIGSLPTRYEVLASEGSFLSGVTMVVSEKTGLSADALYVFRPQRGAVADYPNQPLDDRHPSLSPFFVAFELLTESGGEEVANIPMLQRLFQTGQPSSCHACYNRSEPEKLLRCTKCNRAAYCNKQCQIAHWRVHSQTCRKKMEPCGVTGMITLPASQVTYQTLSLWALHYASLSVDAVHRDQRGAAVNAPHCPLTSSGSGSITSSTSTYSLGSNTSSNSNSSSGGGDTSDSSNASTAAAGSPRTPTASSSSSSSSSSSPVANANAERAALSSSSGESVARAATPVPPFHLSIIKLDKGETHTSPGTRLDRNSDDVIDVRGDSVVALDWRNALNHKDAVDVTVRQDMRCDQKQAKLQDRDRPSQQCPVSIQDCLQKFIEPEILERDQEWYCPKCKGHKQASKQLSIWKLPDTIVIHLKRFNKLLHKLSDDISFPLTGLSLAESCAPGSPELRADGSGLDRTLYDLCAVANHIGVAGGGHYTAFCREESDNIEVAADDPGTWLSFDDRRVSVMAPAAVVSPKAYLLFYRRRHMRRSPPVAGQR